MKNKIEKKNYIQFNMKNIDETLFIRCEDGETIQLFILYRR